MPLGIAIILHNHFHIMYLIINSRRSSLKTVAGNLNFECKNRTAGCHEMICKEDNDFACFSLSVTQVLCAHTQD